MINRRGFIATVVGLFAAPWGRLGRATEVKGARASDTVLAVAGEKFPAGTPVVWGEDGRIYRAALPRQAELFRDMTSFSTDHRKCFPVFSSIRMNNGNE